MHFEKWNKAGVYFLKYALRDLTPCKHPSNYTKNFFGGFYISVLPFGEFSPQKLKQGVCHTVALPLKRILRQKKNYKNSNISPCKTIIWKKSSERNQNSSRY